MSNMSSGSTVTVEELRSFHSIDRQIYRRLVINLGLDIIQCMHMIALWLWLEEIGYPNIVLKMLTLPDRVINTIADEAARCLHSLNSDTSPPPLSSAITEIPVTQELMENIPISLAFLYQHRVSALARISKTVMDVTLKAFNDIAQQALLLAINANNNNNHTAHEQWEAGVRFGNTGNQPMGTRTGGSATSSTVLQQELAVGPSSSAAGGGLIRPVYQVQHPLIYGTGIGISPPPAAMIGDGGARVLPHMIGPMGQPHAGAGVLLRHRRINNPGLPKSSAAVEVGESSHQTSFLNPMANPWAPNDMNDEVPPGDRTMFITFSRGYPITERELRAFFVRLYGECIEDLYMQEVPPNRQSLYARVVFRSLRIIAAILDGKDKAKFAINGKHVWARLFVDKTKQNQSAEVPQTPAAEPS
ncbi:hypothetical protein BVC80_939g1 [Macleaya cordata]|uniref:Uncharacterized protein n=1 Tax=Macleaya cordata TaxID=56857 RepID=A0A200QAF6_MACCD|nr:hypothetical protein BVC80_939g1 [Macleaya cordata]